MAALPTGTITFLFTDVEGSSQPWEEHPAAMRQAMARHDALLTDVFEQHDGVVVRPRGEGDSLFAVFIRATDAVAAALAGQRALVAEDWGVIGPLRVRMALLTGEADLREGDYYGSAVNRCARIRSAGYGGQILLAQTTEQLVRGHLPPGAGLRSLSVHRLRGQSQPETIYQLEAPDLPEHFPPLKTLDVRPNNLPLQLTSFVGREREVGEVVELLQRARLVTLTGPGGTGKTRLALAVAAELLDDFPDGVFFIDLAPLSDPEGMPSAVARVLGIPERPDLLPRDSVERFLREKHLLLLLDNFEHLLAAATFIGTLLQAAPAITLLVTSRAPLRVGGEREYPVFPLAVPPEQAGTAAQIRENAAIKLFVSRAQDVRPDFTLTDANAATVASICARLDGLPLAIELAAARVRALPPPALLARLEHPLALLTGGRRDAPDRQRTIRDTIAWSYELLEPAEQRLFRRLGVFVGGWTLEAAAAVCDVDGDLGIDVLDGISSLVEESLIRELPDEGAESRYGMLETIREFAFGQLDAAAEAEALRRLHCGYVLRLSEDSELHLTSAAREPWLRRLDAEQDNLRAALGWVITTGDAAVALRLTGALMWYWFFRGYSSEGRRWLAAALAVPGAEERTAGRAKALAGVWWLAFEQGEGRTGRAGLEESVSIWRTMGDERFLAHALVFLGLAHRTDHDHAALRACFDESVALFHRLGDRWGLAHALYFSAAGLFGSDPSMRRPGDAAAVRTLIEQSHALFWELDDPWGLSGTLWYLGRIASRQGDTPAAQALLADGLAAARRARDDWRIAAILSTLADLASDTQDAAVLYRESLQLAGDVGYKETIATCLAGLARLAWAKGQPKASARLLGAVSAIMDAMGMPADHHRRHRVDRAAMPLRAALGEDTFAAIWSTSANLPVEAATTLGITVAAELEQLQTSAI